MKFILGILVGMVLMVVIAYINVKGREKEGRNDDYTSGYKDGHEDGYYEGLYDGKFKKEK